MYQWVKSSGGSSDDLGFKVVSDNANNIYILGFYKGTATFGTPPNSETHTSRGDYDGFLMKLDPTGAFNWARTLGSIYGDELGDIAYTPVTNNIYMTGSYSTTIAFGPGLGTNSIGSFNTSSNVLNGFLAKYDLDGNIIWSVRQGSTNSYNNTTTGVSTDSNGNPYICGVLNYDSYFSSYNSTSNYYVQGVHYEEPFIAKYNSNGSLLWVIAAVDGYNDSCVNLVVQNNIANVVGTFHETINFGF